MQNDRPDVVLSLREMWTANQLDALEDGVVDIAFVCYNNATDKGAFVVVPIAEEHVIAAIPDTHRLAGQAHLAISDLAADPFILPPSDDFGETLRDEVLRLCGTAGFAPRIVQESNDLQVVLGLVSAGIGVTLLTTPADRFRTGGIPTRAFGPR